MMVVFAIKVFDVQRNAGILRERLEPLAEQFGIHFADFGSRKFSLPDQEGAARHVDRDPRQRFVHGQLHVAIADDAGLVPQRLGDGLTKHDAGIFGGVVEIDVKIALRPQHDVDQTMAGQLLQHMVKKTDAGLNVIGAGAVEIDGRRDLGFLGLAGDRRLAFQRSSPVGRIGGTVAALGKWMSRLVRRHAGGYVPDFVSRPLTVTAPRQQISHDRARAAAGACPLIYVVRFLNPRLPMSNTPTNAADSSWHATTILTVRKGGVVVIAGDGQVSLGQTIIKSNAKKVRRLGRGDVIGGFAGATADAFTLFERLEAKLEQHPGQLQRAAVELAKDWRTDRYLRRLEAMMIVADREVTLVLTGNGDVLEPEKHVMGIGSGGNYALAAARALFEQPLDAETIARKAMAIAAEICVYTNSNVVLESLDA